MTDRGEFLEFDFNYKKGNVRMLFKDMKGQEQTVEGPILSFDNIEVHMKEGKWTCGYAYRLPEM